MAASDRSDPTDTGAVPSNDHAAGVDLEIAAQAEHLDLAGVHACAHLETRDGHTAYAGSKRALTVWMRRNVTAYAGGDVRLNAVAPGITRTPLSERVMDVCRRFTPLVEQISIDEAFLDVAGSEGLHGTPEAMARSIKVAIADEQRPAESVERIMQRQDIS